MATNTWVGNALDRKQVDTITPANVNIGNTFTCTINGKAITVTATAATVANVTALLTAAWNVSTIPEFAEITATDSTTHVTLTADVAGVPFTVTSSASGGTATNTRAASTANSSKSDWNNTANWSAGTVPVSTEDLYFDGAMSNVSVLYNLAQSAVIPASLNFLNDYSGDVGAKYTNETDTTNTYLEYRSTELAIGPTKIVCNCSSGRIKITAGTSQTNLIVTKTGSSDDGLPVLQFRGTHASNALTVSGGSVGVAVLGTHTATLLTMNVRGGVVTCGAGTTIGTIDQTGGSITVMSNATSITSEAGEFRVLRR